MRHASRMSRGFTLAEMLCVLLILGLISSMAISRMGEALARRRVEMSARQIAADLEMAARNARAKSTTATVTFDVARDKYAIAGVPRRDGRSGDYQVDLAAAPYQVDVTAADFSGDAVVRFDIYGAPDSGGSVTLRLHLDQCTVTLDAEGATSVTFSKPVALEGGTVELKAVK